MTMNSNLTQITHLLIIDTYQVNVLKNVAKLLRKT